MLASLISDMALLFGLSIYLSRYVMITGFVRLFITYIGYIELIYLPVKLKNQAMTLGHG